MCCTLSTSRASIGRPVFSYFKLLKWKKHTQKIMTVLLLHIAAAAATAHTQNSSKKNIINYKTLLKTIIIWFMAALKCVHINWKESIHHTHAYYFMQLFCPLWIFIYCFQHSKHTCVAAASAASFYFFNTESMSVPLQLNKIICIGKRNNEQ